jgi:hypothetical protein
VRLRRRANLKFKSFRDSVVMGEKMNLKRRWKKPRNRLVNGAVLKSPTLAILPWYLDASLNME